VAVARCGGAAASQATALTGRRPNQVACCIEVIVQGLIRHYNEGFTTRSPPGIRNVPNF
jgi:hypothetical protein